MADETLVERMKRLKKATAKAVATKTLSETDYYDYDKYGAVVDPLIFNLALGGKLLEGGLTPGVTILSGQSKTYKTVTGITLVHHYLQHFPDAICIFYDAELGGPGYWDMVGADQDRVLHIVIRNIEELRFDIAKKLDAIKPGEHIIFFVDSLGMLASTKELADALKENSASDMTRAKELKAYFRQITPTLNDLHIPLVAINNNYASMDKYNPEAMGGGGGIVLAANTVLWFRKSKYRNANSPGATDGDLAGHNFTITVFKSRFIKEGTKLPFRVLYGQSKPNRYSGLYDMAVRTGDIYSPSKGWRAAVLVDEEGKPLPKEQHVKFREAEAFDDPEFWEEVMLKKTNFTKNVERRVSLYYTGPDDFTNEDYGMIELDADDDVDGDEEVNIDPETGEILE